jgi:lambda family phage portal protein
MARALLYGPNGAPIAHTTDVRDARMDAFRNQLRRLRAGYDAAQTNDDNSKHWAAADALSADAAASPQVRRTLRNRSRYERKNNCYCSGLVRRLSADCIGTGPRLRLMAGPSPAMRKDASKVEGIWSEWCQAVGLAEKLRTMRAAGIVDGEAFALDSSNPNHGHPITLDIRLIEADQVASLSWQMQPEENYVDGIRFDTYGNPIQYEVLNSHPGSNGYGALKSTQYPARSIQHYFRSDRPGQRRGVPELTPALPLFAILRRWTLASLMSAEAAANFSMLLFTENPPDEETYNAKPFDALEIERNMMMTLPAGWKPSQMKAEHPNATFREVEQLIVAEIGVSLELPYILISGYSGDANYASNRTDLDGYRNGNIRIERTRVEAQVVRKIFNAWRSEAILIEGLLPQSFRMTDSDWSHQWMWDGWGFADPSKEASAQEKKLANKTTTLAEEYSAKGQDWEEQLEQIAREQRKMSELGIVSVEAPLYSDQGQPEADGENDGEEMDDESEPQDGGAKSSTRSAAKTGDVQQTALNGAQVAALQEILTQVATGVLDKSAAIEMILLSFPLFDRKRVTQMVVAATRGASARQKANQENAQPTKAKATRDTSGRMIGWEFSNAS